MVANESSSQNQYQSTLAQNDENNFNETDKDKDLVKTHDNNMYLKTNFYELLTS